MADIEMKWFKIASMDKRVLKDTVVCCLSAGVKYHMSDDGVNPPAVWFLSTYGTYRSICGRVGFAS
jgi:hypothetical protein